MLDYKDFAVDHGPVQITAMSKNKQRSGRG